MGTQDFISNWKTIGKEHLHAHSSNNKKFNLGLAAYDLLFLIGMPSEFQDLNFDYLKDEELKTVNQKWSLGNPEFDKYLSIGFNGSGDPIVINIDNQELLYLNHDNHFEEVFINSDMKKFALSVLRVKRFVEQIKKLHPDSFFETEFSDEQLENTVQDLNRIDSIAFEREKSHWKITLDSYNWFRKEERNA